MDYIKNNGKTITGRSLASALFLIFSISFLALPTFAEKEESWEQWVLKGNDFRERDRVPDARRCYNSAMKILEKQDINDVRKAIVLHDIAETYRMDSKLHNARMKEISAEDLYKEEIRGHQLGREYAVKKPISHDQTLRPACFLCHENWKVVPIFYGPHSGYKGETPPESDPSFTHFPGGPEYRAQRWYCRDCHQAF